MAKALFAKILSLFILLTSVGMAHGTAAAANSAVFVSQNVLSTMVTDQSYSVSVVMSNNGTTTWPAGSTYKLGSKNPNDNSTWQIARVVVASPVSPGQSYTFNFTIRAPSVTGTYNFQWGMLEEYVEWFGASSPNVSVTVAAPAPVNNAAYVSHTVPPSMDTGMSYPVEITMKNTGNTTWAAGGNYRIGTQNPSDNGNWQTSGPNGNRVIVGTPVAPGANYTFRFNVTAPAGGTYNFQWKMVEEFKEWFGAMTTNSVVNVIGSAPALALNCIATTPTVSPQAASASCALSNPGKAAASSIAYSSIPGVTISGPTGYCAAQASCGTVLVTTGTSAGTYAGTLTATPNTGSAASAAINLVVSAPLVNNAAFVSQTVSDMMVAGNTYPVTVQMKNTGTTTWPAGAAHRLGSQNPENNLSWSVGREGNRIAPEVPVKPNETYTFKFDVTAPAHGTPNFQWQMVEEYKEWFGAKTNNVVVAVSPPPPGNTWTAVAAAMAANDKSKVLAHFTDPAKYDEMFTAVGNRLAEIGQSMANLNFIEIKPRYATAQVAQTVNGVVTQHFVTFVLVDGAWYISEF